MGNATYFISYTTRTENDVKWAVWLEYILREIIGGETIMQKYDFHPGDNFKALMDDALAQADIVICVLTKAYMESINCREEWTNAKRYIPVRCDDCNPSGLLKSRVCIDLYGLDEESAYDAFVNALQGEPRPDAKPVFPFGSEKTVSGLPEFPEYTTNNLLDTAKSYDSIGLVYHNQMDYKTALRWYEKALAVREKVLGEEHSDTAKSYDNIGLIHHNQRDYDGALEWYGKALAIREKALGKEHPDTVKTYDSIGLIHRDQGDYEGALEWYGKALAIREKVLGKEHPDTVRTYKDTESVNKAQ